MKQIWCNKCGNEIGPSTLDFNDRFSIHTRIGYGSKHDGEMLWLTLCSSCMDKLIDVCAISPVHDEEAWKDGAYE